MLQANDFEQAITRLRVAGLIPTFERIAVTKLLLDSGSDETLADLVDRAHEHDLPLAESQIAAVLDDLREVGLAAKGPAEMADDSFAAEAWDVGTLLKAIRSRANAASVKLRTVLASVSPSTL